MKKNSKFLWLYTAILFSFALIFIVFAGLTQNNFQKELQERESNSKGMQESLTVITEKNQMLNDQIAELIEKTEEQSKKIEEFEKAEEIESKNDEIILDAYKLYDAKKRSEASKKLAEIKDVESLNEQQSYMYYRIK